MRYAYLNAMEPIQRIWPTIAELARDLGKPYPTVAAWAHRGWVPGKHDLDVIEAAEAKGHSLSLEELAIARRDAQAKSKEAGAA